MADTTVSTDTAPGAPEGTNAPTGSGRPKTTLQTRPSSAACAPGTTPIKKEAADLDEDDSDYEAKQAANQAYLRATPPLAGYKNICDFIACINFACMIDLISPIKAQQYLANAKIAILAVCHQPKSLTGEHRPLGRPPKSSATEEK
jgi:hypothetical protein